MLNKVMLIGNLGRDPEVRYFDSGIAKAQFPIATSETYKDKSGEKVTQTEWHNVVAWRGLAEVVEKYVKKGDKIYIEGKIRTRSYDDKDGVKKYVTEIVADNLQMLSPKPMSNDATPPQETTTITKKETSEAVDTSETTKANETTEGDDLPF